MRSASELWRDARCGREAIVPIALLHQVGACACHKDCDRHWNHDHFDALLHLSHSVLDDIWAQEPRGVLPYLARTVHYNDLRFGLEMSNEVTLFFNPDGKTQATVGVPPAQTLTVASYNEALVKERTSIGEFEAKFRADNPEATPEKVIEATNNFVVSRILECEEFMKVTKLKWIMGWRVLEERLKTQSDSERQRIRNLDKQRRNVAVGGPKPLKERVKAAPIIDPKLTKEENAIRIMMSRLGLTEQEAKDRLRGLAIVTGVAPVPPTEEQK